MRNRLAPAVRGEHAVARFRAKVGAFVEKVKEACIKQEQQQPELEARSQYGAEAFQRPGERSLRQAKALRRAIFELEGMGIQSLGSRRDKYIDNRLRNAQGNVNSAFALTEDQGGEADADVEESSGRVENSSSSFTKAAQEVLHAAKEIQRIGEMRVEKEGAQTKGARELVRVGLGELNKIGVDLKSSSLEGNRSIAKVIRATCGGLEKMFRILADGEIEALVESGGLEYVLRRVDKARVVVSRAHRLLRLEDGARELLDALVLEAQELRILERPAVMLTMNACRAAATIAEQFDSQRGKFSLEKRETQTKEYIAVALLACEATGRAEKNPALELDATATNDEVRCRLEERLGPLRSDLSRLQDRLDRLSTAVEQHRMSLDGVRVLAASWNDGRIACKVFAGPLPAEPNGQLAEQAIAQAGEGLDAVLREAETCSDGGVLDDNVKVGLQRVTAADATAAKAEVCGRRRLGAIAALERAAAKTGSAIAEAQTAKVIGRSTVAEFLFVAANQVATGIRAAVDTAGLSGVGELKVDNLLLITVEQGEQAAEDGSEALSREGLIVEIAEKERQKRSSKLWSAARQLESLDTLGVFGDDLEAAAMVLEAQSEALQVTIVVSATFSFSWFHGCPSF